MHYVFNDGWESRRANEHNRVDNYCVQVGSQCWHLLRLRRRTVREGPVDC